MTNQNFKKKCLASLTVLASTLPLQVSAAANILEETIVTAQKREQNLQDVPIAVTAFTGQRVGPIGCLYTCAGAVTVAVGRTGLRP